MGMMFLNISLSLSVILLILCLIRYAIINILKDVYDISDFGLSEIPSDEVYCFMKYQKNFSERLVGLRKKQKITLQTLADILEIKQPSVSAYEVGKAFPTAHNLIKIALYFNVSIDFLIGRTENPEISK